jgi:SLOG cluster3 family
MKRAGVILRTLIPFLIQFAVREFLTAALGRRLVVWGGHPAITPMVWAVCEDLGVMYSDAVVLYQSRFFEEYFPEENARFKNVEYVEASGDREASLLLMRKTMLSRKDLNTAVFIGGMKGILVEHEMFSRYHPNAKVLPVGSPGGAAKELALKIAVPETKVKELDFVHLFHSELGIEPDEKRRSDLHG